MRVGELQERLSKLDPKLEVLCYAEDEALLGAGESAFLDIEAVDVTEAEPYRNDEGQARLRFGKGEVSQKYVLLQVTSDF